MPSGRKREFNETEVIDRATLRFATHGFGGSSLSDLEETMGIGRQSIYDAFGDKRTLYRRCLEQYRERIVQPLICAIRKESDPQRLADLVFGMVEGAIRSRPSPASLLIGALVEMEYIEPPLARVADDIFATLKRELTERFAAMVGTNPLPCGATPEGIAASLITTLIGLLASARGRETSEWLNAALAHARTCWAAGFSAHSRHPEGTRTEINSTWVTFGLGIDPRIPRETP